MENQNPHFSSHESKFAGQNYPQQQDQKHLPSLPKAIGVLITGIVSLVLCLSYGIGIIFAIISLSMSKTAMDAYNENPSGYRPSTLKLVKMGRTFAVFGLILGIVFLTLFIMYFKEITDWYFGLFRPMRRVFR